MSQSLLGTSEESKLPRARKKPLAHEQNVNGCSDVPVPSLMGKLGLSEALPHGAEEARPRGSPGKRRPSQPRATAPPGLAPSLGVSLEKATAGTPAAPTSNLT